mmetsp:Transcript_7085/g.13355  ORF Transcript_7085/g.13355 Transcript_7085/m.13355 type:complete len:390 (-) Transcript_7085:169-1338(-)
MKFGTTLFMIAATANLKIILLRISPVLSFSIAMSSSSTTKSKLYDLPVSNNGARCRIILYKKEIPEQEVKIVSPADVGGLKSPEYLTMNPLGKMPLLSIEGGMNIPESDTICRYLMSTYADRGPDFLPNEVRSNAIARIHDMYITTIQGALYKAAPPFGIYGTRSDALKELQTQLKLIDDLVEDDRDGTYLCGKDVSLADASLFPTMIFIDAMFPKFGIENGIPLKLKTWFDQVRDKDSVFAKVYEEVKSGIDAWESKGRWNDIWLAGLRDDAPQTIFDKLITGEIPANVVYEDDKVFAFKDINPSAPAHILVIPKDRMNLSGLHKSSPEHIEILGRLLVAAGEISTRKDLGFVNGGRIVINDGKDAGQEIPHLHVHVLGGRSLTWPPG